jgi:type II secretory pathway component PulM
MAAVSALVYFENLNRQLDQVSQGLKAIEQAGWAGKSVGDASAEAVKSAARELALKATELARDAMQVCVWLEALPPPRKLGRARKKQSN